MPIGVVPSPSRWCADSPFRPTCAGHAGARRDPAARPSAATAAATRSSTRAVAASTVTSCRGAPVERGRCQIRGARVAAAGARQGRSRRDERCHRDASESSDYAHGRHGARSPSRSARCARGPGADQRRPVEPAAFTHSVAAVTRAELGRSYHAGCPVGPAELRLVRLRYWGFDRRAHNGSLVVDERPCRRSSRSSHACTPSASRSAACSRSPPSAAATAARWRPTTPRPSTAATRSRPGPNRWSVHAFGEAIDVNTVENPYVEGGDVRPRAGRPYLDRSRVPARDGRAPAAPSSGRSPPSAGSGAVAGPDRRTTSTSRPPAGSEYGRPRWARRSSCSPSPSCRGAGTTSPPTCRTRRSRRCTPAPASRSAPTTSRRSSRWR